MDRKVVEFYETAYAKGLLEGDLARPEDRIRFCFPRDVTGKRILDVGCGPGVQVCFFTANNQVHGVDLSRPALEHAAANGLTIHHTEVEADGLPFPDGHFDILVCTDPLEHLFDPPSVIREIKRAVRSDGFAIIAVPNHFFWSMQLQILLGSNLALPWH